MSNNFDMDAPLDYNAILQITLNSVNDAVICIDLVGNIFLMNHIAENLSGYSMKETIGMPLAKIFHISSQISNNKKEPLLTTTTESEGNAWLSNHYVLVSNTGNNYFILETESPIITSNGEKQGTVMVFRNISEQYLAELQLFESEQRFRHLFQNMKEGVALHELILDSDGNPVNYRITQTNPAYEQHTGVHLQKGEKPLADEFYKSSIVPYLDEFSAVAITGKSCVFETFFPPLKKHFHISVISTQKNTFATIFEDITERITIINELTESETRFRKLFEDSADAIILINNGYIIDCNRAAIKLLKYKSKKLLIGNTPALISPEFQEDLCLSSEKAISMMQIAYKQGKHKFEWNHLCYNNTIIECEIMLTSMVHKGNQILHAVMRDNTERKNAIRKLTESEEKFRTLYETMAQGVIYYDNEGKIISANKSAERIFEMVDLGNSNTSVGNYNWITTSIDGIVLGKNEFPVIIALRTGKEVRNVKLGIYSSEISRHKWINVNAIPLFIEESKEPIKAYVTIEDITDLIEIEKELIKEKQRAEQSDKLKTAFLANMSHEIRTPMNAIMGFSQLMLNQNTHESTKQYYAEIINNSCKNLLRIIDDLLDISKIESGQMNLIKSPLNLKVLLEKVKTIFSQLIKTKKKDNLELIFISPATNLYIEADETRLNQILNNLIENAIKFTEKGSIEFGVIKLDKYLEFYVKDTGIGIPPDVHDKVFERFWQADDNRVRSSGGTGLGLPICKKLVEIMGGSIRLESEIGIGSSFYFTLPYHDDVKYREETKSIKNIASSKRKIELLVVEDDLINAQYLKEILKRYENCITDFAYDGYSALEKIQQKQFDIVLLDIQLPGLNGFEVAAKIRESNSNIIIIAQTAFAMPEDKARCLKSGFDNYISKPINFKDLFDLLNLYA